MAYIHTANENSSLGILLGLIVGIIIAALLVLSIRSFGTLGSESLPNVGGSIQGGGPPQQQ